MTLPEYLAVRGVPFKSHSKHDEVRVCCPFCHEQRFRLGLNWSLNVGHCFNCGWKSRNAIGSFLRALGLGFPREDERRLLGARYVGSREEEEERAKKVRLPGDFMALSSISEEDGPPFVLALRYWLDRGFTIAEARRFSIGASFSGRYAYRIIMPVIYHGEVASFLARSFANRDPKYLNSPGTRYVWNLDRKTDRIVMAEGVLKAIALQRVFPDLRVTAALGHSLSEAQLDQIAEMQVQGVFLWPDPDSAGLLGVLDMAAALASRGVEVEVPYGIPVRQADEMPISKLRSLLASGGPLTKVAEMRYRYEAGRRKR